jgi:outer membrane lipoprotein-sorting protein
MLYQTMIKTALGFLLILSACQVGRSTESLAGCQSKEADANSIEAILSQLKQKTAELKTYQCLVEYEVNQPVFETRTLRKGILYYAKYGKISKLRVNFQTLKQDVEKEQKYAEHFIFDGIWLTRINYKIKRVERRQLAEPNEAAEPFDLASRNLPVIGFTKIEELKKQFEIKFIQPEKDKAENSFHLYLKVKPDSKYKDDYTVIDFWIDKNLTLPTKVIAITTEEDIYEIRFLKPQINKKIDPEVFKFDVPEDFTIEVITLSKKGSEEK